MRITPVFMSLFVATAFSGAVLAQSTTPPVVKPVVVAPPVATPPAVTLPVPAPTVPGQQPPATDPAITDGQGDTLPLPPDAPTDQQPGDDFSIGDIPNVETVELTPETARKALDVYVLVRDKYQDASLEEYENLQDFVDQAPQGKNFDADIKAAGFTNVDIWNTTVTTISFAYANQVDDQTANIKQQIEDVGKDEAMAQDMRDRMTKALNAMIPSDNNARIVADLLKDPAYGDKVKLLETESE